MKIGVIGLGKMGAGVAERAIKGNHSVIGFDFSGHACQEAQKIGCEIADNLTALVQAVDLMWLFVPAGDPVDTILDHILPVLHKGSIIIDGGNSHFIDSIRRANRCDREKVLFLDCGTSGGLAGRNYGYSLMVGGDEDAYRTSVPVLRAVAAHDGFGYVGRSGAGHYVKMVHNGIEYGVLQAYAEGMHLLRDGSFKADKLDLAEICRIWQHGALLSSRFLDLIHEVLKKDQQLDTISGEIGENGTGAWMVEDAHQHKIPVTVIEDALKTRAWSRQTGGNYATRLIALIRNAFGGHPYKKSEK